MAVRAVLIFLRVWLGQILVLVAIAVLVILVIAVVVTIATVAIDELNLRLWTYIESEYHHQPHSALSGRTPLEVWETDAEQIRWADDHAQLEHAFYGEVERWVRNDSTIQWRGIFYEVPPEFAPASRVDIRFPFGRPDELVLYRDDRPLGPIRPVDPVDNARFHAVPVDVSYSELLKRRQEEEAEE